MGAGCAMSLAISTGLGGPGGGPGLQRGLWHPDKSRCLSPRNTTVLNSKVISVTVKPPPRSLLTPLEIEFAHVHNVSAIVCATPVWPSGGGFPAAQ